MLTHLSAAVLLACLLGGAAWQAPPESSASQPGPSRRIVFAGRGSNGGAWDIPFDIYSVDAMGGSVQNLTNTPDSEDYYPVWSPDKTRIAWASDRTGVSLDVWVMNADGTNPRQVTSGPGSSSGREPSWFPGGDRLLYQCTVSICAIDVDGGNQETVVAGTGANRFDNPHLSSDGSRIVATRTTGGLAAIVTMDSDGNNQEVLTTEGGGAKWSPDGSKVMYSVLDANLAALLLKVIDVATRETDTILSREGLGSYDWSPDGQFITFSDFPDGLWVADANGSNPAQVSTIEDVQWPDWGANPLVHSVEFTQAIQEWQSLPELKADLEGAGLPVPIVAGKPAAMRVYLSEVDATTNYTVEVTGQISETKNLTITPGCTVTDQRRQDLGCNSVDFFFTPPSGEWTVRLVVKDFVGEILQEEEFKLTSLDTSGLVVKYLPICVKLTPGAQPTCPSSAVETTAPNLMRKLFPAAEDELTYSRLPIPRMVLDAPVSTAADTGSLTASLRLRYELMTFTGGYTADQVAGWLPAGGTTGLLGISDPVWAGSTGRISWQVDTSGTDPLDGQFTLAHEIGHNLGLRHVNLPDGCGARDASTDWPYSDSTIQEVGFDVPAGVATAEFKRDLMSYCSPPGTNIWISPHTYNRLARNNLQPHAIRVAGAGQPGQFLLVSGVAQADGSSASIESAYVITSSVPAEPPNPQGNHCLELSGGQAAEYCFTLEFEEHRSHEPIDSEWFTLRVPLPAGTDRVALMRGTDELAALDATASAPAVTIDEPQTGSEWSGEQTIAWSASDADGGPLNYAVLYSSDGGDSWLPLAVNAGDAEFTFDTGDLEGDEILVRVLASDGLNTTAETTGPVTLNHGLSGDVDCSGGVNSIDALKLSRHVAGLSVSQTEPCPDIGTGDGDIFGDVNCDSQITAVDTLFVLRFVAALPVNVPQGCRPVGT